MPAMQSKTIACKYCGTRQIVKCGSYNGTPRYFCKSCRRKFKDDNHVFHMSVPVTYIEHVLHLFYCGMRINNIINNMQSDFSYHTSAALIHYWINKYTEKAAVLTQKYRPHTGDTWVVDELIVKVGGKKAWLYDIIDDKTRYLLGSQITPTRTGVLVKDLIQTACETTGRIPKMVLVYIPRVSFNKMEKGSGYISEQVPMEVYASHHRIGILSNNDIYRIRNLNYCSITPATANKFFQGLAMHYNYFEKNEKLNGQTPAEAAQISYPYHSWKELIEQSTGKLNNSSS